MSDKTDAPPDPREGNRLVRLKLREPEGERFPEDVTALVDGARADGFEISRYEAQEAWCRHSDTMAAQWLFLPKDPAEAWAEIRHHFVREDGSDA